MTQSGSCGISIHDVALGRHLVVKIHFGLENSTVSKFYLRKPTFRNPPMRGLRKLALNQSEIGVNNMYISVFREYINPTV